MSVNCEITKFGFAIPLEAFRARIGGDKALKKIFNALTTTEIIQPGRPKVIAGTSRHAYRIDRKSGLMYIPKVKGASFARMKTKLGFPVIDAVNVPIEEPLRRLPVDILEPNEPLYECQEVAIDWVTTIQGPAYLQMDTGLGKTRVGCGVIAARGVPALVVVPTDAIATQWVEEFSAIYPKMKVAIYRNQTKTYKKVPPSPTTHDAVIIIINTFRDKTPEFMDGYGTVILDEAHEYHSKSNSNALWLAEASPYALGLSATPIDRMDGMDRYVQLHLGNVIYPKTIPDFDVDAVNFKGQVRIVEYTGNPEYCETVLTPSGTMSAIMTIGAMIKDPHRMMMIAAEIERLYLMHLNDDAASFGLGADSDGKIRRHGVFVFAETREFLPALRETLMKRPKLADTEIFAPEIGISILRGGVAKDAVGTAKKAGSHIVLTTYGFSRRGISLPDMTSIVLATPRRHGLVQILGRILRRGSDESIIRQVVDIVDVSIGLKSQVTDRRKIYKIKNYSMSKVKVHWSDVEHVETEDEVESEDPDLSEMTIDDLLAGL